MEIHIGARAETSTMTAERLRRLAHPLRLAILDLLRRRGELCVCVMAAALGAEQATLSRHLRILRDGRLVLSRRTGHNVLYALDGATLGGVSDAIASLLPPSSERKECAR